MRVLITGGAGFIGTNLSDALCNRGHSVRILDNLSRSGVMGNVEWLRAQHPDVEIVVGDVRNREQVETACQGVDAVYHLAAQVAVTISIVDPFDDFTTNLLGTLNLLQSMRRVCPDAALVYTSTNKVYGSLSGVSIVSHELGYRYADRPYGISEEQPLDFHSPYGCSKGGADQYVHDFSRIYGLKTVVFRMSCIYGQHQQGTEDQGWVAHFARSILLGTPITIYGDGCQVRDILYVGDLVQALTSAVEQTDRTSGRVYNIGGGVSNAVTLRQVIAELEALCGSQAIVSYSDWRPGDQRLYISDTTRAMRDMGWYASTDIRTGLEKLTAHLLESIGSTNLRRISG